MKKVFVLCLFVILSLGLFAQKIKSDGKPHFDKILWELWAKNHLIMMVQVVGD